MAKKKVKTTKKRKQPKKVENQILSSSDRPWIMHVIAIATFLAVSMAYFYPQLQGRVIPQGDIVRYKATAKEINDHVAEYGQNPLWTNAMFGGMPAYQISMQTPGNKTRFVERAFNLFLSRPIGYFVAMMIGFYIMGLALGISPLVSLIGGVAFGLTVNHFVLFEAGHTSKLRAFAFFGLIVAGIINAYRSKFLAGGILFALGMALEIGVNHIQMTYYLFLTLLILVGLFLYRDIKEKELPRFLKASGVLLLAGLLGIAANTSRLWTTYEYAEDTMRGKPILTKETVNESSSSEVEGLAWDYAMGWSNGVLDLFTYMVPGIVGGGSREPVSNSSEFARVTNQQRNNNLAAPLYWGPLPFTSGPSYVGAFVFFLFVLGALITKGNIKWWLVGGTVLTLLLSLGKNFEFFNRLFFEYFPLYNKFRTPNSIMSMTEFLMVLMSTWTLSEIIRGKIDPEKLRKGLLYSGAIVGGLLLFFLLLGSSLFSFSGANDAAYDPRLVDALVSDRKSLLRMDSLRSLVFIGIGVALLYFYIKGKLSAQLMLLGVALSVTVDIWGVGRRYLNANNFVRPNQSEAAFTPRQADQIIAKDTDIYFRVHDLTQDIDKNAIPSYHHKTIGGYHAAKLQRYQDLIDHYLSKGNMSILNMLNTKYLVSPNGELQINAQAYGNAWFVDQLIAVPDANTEIQTLANTDLKTTAIYHEEFADYVGELDPSPQGSVTLTEYLPNKLTYSSQTTSEQFAVFSEIWYGPNKGWTATIDGNPAEFIRVNYAFRGMKIPSGSHEIVFEFRPRSYFVGETISAIASIAILLSLLLWGVNSIKPLNSIIRPAQEA